MNDKEEIKQKEFTPTATNTPNSETTTKMPNDVAKEEQKEYKELTAKETYFATLNEWVKQANISQNAMSMFPWYFMSTYPQLFYRPVAQMPTNSTQNNQTYLPNLNANNLNDNVAAGGFNGFGLRLMNDQAQAEMINRTGGYEYIVAPYWKRALAEIIDMIIMLFFKIGIMLMVTSVFGHKFMIDMDKDVLNKAMDSEDFAGALLFSMDFLDFSSDLLAFEIAAKLLACLYEAILTRFFNGATIGKRVMGLSIKYVEAVVLLPNNGVPPQPVPPIQLGLPAARVQLRALLFPAETPNFLRAFARAVAKNVFLNLLFPMFFLMVFFKNNRTAHDILTKTMVVEKSRQPLVLRRPNQQ
ncbi:hypothetical protein DOY81_013664 [Sarcophaga bullata]|nr:hypothetical protein DOY81_013664 [Sarcophaga bullata]